MSGQRDAGKCNAVLWVTVTVTPLQGTASSQEVHQGGADEAEAHQGRTEAHQGIADETHQGGADGAPQGRADAAET